MIRKFFIQHPELVIVSCITKFFVLLIIAGVITIVGLKEIGRLEDEIVNYKIQIDNYELLIQQLQYEEVEVIEQPRGALTFASWYDYGLNGAPGYSRVNATAASRDYERGTKLVITYGDRSVLVRVNDFGPEYAVFPDRGIDLSSYAFSKLAPLSRGVIEVTIEPVDDRN